MQRLRRRQADAVRQKVTGLGNYGASKGDYSEYDENEVFHARTPGKLRVDANGNEIPDPFYNPLAFTPYNFSINNTSPNGIGNGSVLILSQNLRRQVLIVQNLSSANNMYVNFGTDASASAGILLSPGEGIIFDNGALGCPSNAIYVFFDTATTSNGVIVEGAPVA